MPTTHYRDADLFYRLSGEPENPAMLLLHGGFGSAEDFAAILPELQQHFLVVETDARGHGRSTRGTAELTYAQLAEDAHHIVQVTGLREYHIFGFSDGGTAAYRLAAEDTRVLSVVTVGASWSGVRDASVREMFENLSPALFRERMADRVASYERLNPSPHLETLVDDLRHRWLDTTETGYLNEHVSAIKVPMLAARGENDFLFSLQELAELRRHLPEAHLMNVPFASHEAISEQPGIIWAAMKTMYGL